VSHPRKGKKGVVLSVPNVTNTLDCGKVGYVNMFINELKSISPLDFRMLSVSEDDPSCFSFLPHQCKTYKRVKKKRENEDI